MQWKLGAAIALVVTCPALAEELDQSAVADGLAQLDSMMPRPWCNAERLNPTERSICADRDLSRLDALLELVWSDHRTRRRRRSACLVAVGTGCMRVGQCLYCESLLRTHQPTGR